MSKCGYEYGKVDCLNTVSKLTHPGTQHKINFMRSYIDSWYNIVLQGGYNGVIFIDCMSNCGAYNDRGAIINGTSQEAMRSFLNQNGGTQYSRKNFSIVVNDLDAKRIVCQKCLWERNNLELGSRKNVKFFTRNEDVSDFLRGYALDLLKMAEIKKYHVLLFYDPYQAKIDWEGLSPFLKSNYVDTILTHFSSDTIRGIGTVKNLEKKTKYEGTYGIKFDELKKGLNSSENKPLTFLRSRILEKVREISVNKLVTYGPIFNSVNRVIYDIVLISKAPKTRILLKEKLYKEYRELPEEIIQGSLFALDDDENELAYDSQREMGISEKDYFYSPEQFAKFLYNKFKGQIVTNSNYNDFIEAHDFIPSNANKQIDPILRSKYLVEITNASKKKNIPEKLYDFRGAVKLSE